MARKRYSKDFTPEQIRTAHNVPLAEFLQSKGYELRKTGNTEYRLEPHSSFVVRMKQNDWYWNADKSGGDPIDFLVVYEHKAWRDAVAELLEWCGETAASGGSLGAAARPAATLDRARREPAPLTLAARPLPPAFEDSRRCIAYLTISRGIAPSIVRELIERGELYEDAKHHNAVFVTRDTNGIPRWCFKRGTNTYSPLRFRGEETWSEKAYAWRNVGALNQIYIFEAVIDALSFASLLMLKRRPWKAHTLISLAGVSCDAIDRFIREHPQAASCEIVVCTDNDDGGTNLWQWISERYKGTHRMTRLCPFFGKDWNDTLTAYRKGEMKLGEMIL